MENSMRHIFNRKGKIRYINVFGRRPLPIYVDCAVNVMCLPCHWQNIYVAQEEHTKDGRNTKYKPSNKSGRLPKKRKQEYKIER